MDSTAKVFDSTTADNASRGLGGEGLARHGGVKEKRPHREPCAARNSRASSRRSSFPMADLGSASRNSTCFGTLRSEEHTSELQSPCNLVCRLLLEKKKKLGTASITSAFTPVAFTTLTPSTSKNCTTHASTIDPNSRSTNRTPASPNIYSHPGSPI